MRIEQPFANKRPAHPPARKPYIRAKDRSDARLDARPQSNKTASDDPSIEISITARKSYLSEVNPITILPGTAAATFRYCYNHSSPSLL